MKNLFVLLLAASLVLGLAGCGGEEGRKGEGSESVSSQAGPSSATPSGTPFTPSQPMKDDVISFIESFPQSFDTTNELDTYSICWFSFWQIWEAGLASSQGDGAYFISSTQLNEYVASHFGIHDLAYPPDAMPRYQPDRDGYDFYPIGEGSMYEVEIEAASMKQDLVSFDVAVTRQGMSASDPATEPVKRLRYLFQLQTESGGNQILQAVRAVPIV